MDHDPTFTTKGFTIRKLRDNTMAIIDERINGKGEKTYRVRIRLKGHPTKTATFKRKTDAKAWAQQEEAKLRTRRHFTSNEDEKHTLNELIERYKSEELPKLRSDHSKRESHLDWWSSRLGKYFLRDISPALLTECRDKLLSEPIIRNGEPVEGSSKSPATVNRYLATLSAAFTCAVKDWAWMQENPMLKVRKPKEPRGRVRFLSNQEQKDLMTAVQAQEKSEPFLYPVVSIALATGARWSEILNLRWENIDFKHNMIRIEETKNDERRSLPIGKHLKNVLKAHHGKRRIDTSLVFPRSDGKAPKQIRKSWEKALEDSGVTDFHFHDLRHTCASNLAMNGASLLDIAHILGHKTIQVTKRYSHLTKHHTAEVVERMNEAIFGGADHG